MIDNLNQYLFALINAGPDSSSFLQMAGIVASRWLFWLVPLSLVIGWFFGSQRLRHALLIAVLAAFAGLFANLIVGFIWPHPRPFMIGLGQLLVSHKPEPSFPSDHLTVVWAVAFSLLGSRGSGRTLGLGIAALGVLIAWARIFVGVHFPLDMLGSAIVAALVSTLAWSWGSRLTLRVLQLSTLVEKWFFDWIKSFIRRGPPLEP